jgi:hypothetical protein
MKMSISQLSIVSALGFASLAPVGYSAPVPPTTPPPNGCTTQGTQSTPFGLGTTLYENPFYAEDWAVNTSAVYGCFCEPLTLNGSTEYKWIALGDEDNSCADDCPANGGANTCANASQ